ncbi:MAG: DNA alkylation repair protein, partial [Clostridia bacterium]|nr:DNA alkylation repair protein [Clostridia bacterium]
MAKGEKMVKGVIKEIREELFNKSDAKYRDFQAKLIPTVKPESIIGVRTPELRKMAKVYAKNENIDAFLNDLPHN